MIYLNGEETRAALPMVDAIEAMTEAFSPDTETPLRVQLGSSLFMTGRVKETAGIKVVSVVPGNPVGIVAVFDADGNPVGLVDGPTLTAIRTGAGAGLATRILSSERATTLAMLGAGAMAFDQIEAIRAVRQVERVLVWSRNRVNAESLAERVDAEAVDDPDEAVRQAQIVSCATPSERPLFADGSVRPGTHINAVGSFKPSMVEVPAETVDRAYVVVDDYEAAAAEAGDLIQANRQPNASLTEVLAGSNPQIGEDVTFFKSVGVAPQDVAAARTALENAVEMGIGVRLS